MRKNKKQLLKKIFKKLYVISNKEIHISSDYLGKGMGKKRHQFSKQNINAALPVIEDQIDRVLCTASMFFRYSYLIVNHFCQIWKKGRSEGTDC